LLIALSEHNVSFKEAMGKAKATYKKVEKSSEKPPAKKKDAETKE